MMSMGKDSLSFNDPVSQIEHSCDLVYDGTFNTESHQAHSGVQVLRLR